MHCNNVAHLCSPLLVLPGHIHVFIGDLVHDYLHSFIGSPCITDCICDIYIYIYISQMHTFEFLTDVLSHLTCRCKEGHQAHSLRVELSFEMTFSIFCFIAMIFRKPKLLIEMVFQAKDSEDLTSDGEDSLEWIPERLVEHAKMMFQLKEEIYKRAGLNIKQAQKKDSNKQAF